MTSSPTLGHAARTALASVAAKAAPGPPTPDGARVVVHFHPDADARGRRVLRGLLHDGRYASQFVTGTSNGGLTAVPGGERWRWEHNIFGGAYDAAGADERPIYGALRLSSDPYGAAPRFGSAYLRLRPEATQRSSFAYPDSYFEPELFGVAAQLGLIAAFEEDAPDDPLNHYIEAHVHGGLHLPSDVEAIVVDPSFDDEPALDAAEAIGLPVERHPGYAVDVETLRAHLDYRGPDIVALAERIASDGALTPASIAAARRARTVDPQLLKRVWHCVARYGREWPGIGADA